MANLSDYLEIEHIYSRMVQQDVRTLSVSAVNACEGVTMLAYALALRCTKAFKRTLLVDMNYCRPSLDLRCALRRKHWQMDDSSLKSAIQLDRNGVFVLPASLSLDSRLRQRAELDALVSQWSKEFDQIIFDTSPLNAINRFNLPAEHVCASSQSCVLVMRSASTKEADILAGLSKLKSQRADILGWVMNDVECPSLASEMQREVLKLERYFPRLARWLDSSIAKNNFINQVM